MTDRKVINLFTHTDLDGVGCSILMHIHASDDPRTLLYAHYCDYEDINESVNSFLDLLNLAEEENYQAPLFRDIYITDISVNEDTAKRLDELDKQNPSIAVHLIDHHRTAEWLNKYSWAYVNSNPEVCGTTLLYDDLFAPENNALDEFVNAVCLYDTWRFNPHDLSLSKQLNYLLNLFGTDEFALYCLGRIMTGGTINRCFTLTDDVWTMTYCRDRQIKEYVKDRVDNANPILFDGLACVGVCASQYVSQVGNGLVNEYPTAMFAVVIDLEKQTVHLRGGDRSPDLGAIAKRFGGGGHPKAAAFKFNYKPGNLLSSVLGDE